MEMGVKKKRKSADRTQVHVAVTECTVFINAPVLVVLRIVR